MRITVGENIRLIRKHLGLTQEQLAEQFGHSNGSLSMIENGEVATTVDTIDKIALAFGCNGQALCAVGGYECALAQIEKQRQTRNLDPDPDPDKS